MRLEAARFGDGRGEPGLPATPGFHTKGAGEDCGPPPRAPSWGLPASIGRRLEAARLVTAGVNPAYPPRLKARVRTRSSPRAPSWGLPALIGRRFEATRLVTAGMNPACLRRFRTIRLLAARLAQWIERLTSDQEVASSSLAAGTTPFEHPSRPGTRSPDRQVTRAAGRSGGRARLRIGRCCGPAVSRPPPPMRRRAGRTPPRQEATVRRRARSGPRLTSAPTPC